MLGEMKGATRVDGDKDLVGFVLAVGAHNGFSIRYTCSTSRAMSVSSPIVASKG